MRNEPVEPGITNKPQSKTITRTVKEVKITLSKLEIENALHQYLIRYYAEFRNMDIEFNFLGSRDDLLRCECVAVREQEKKR